MHILISHLFSGQRSMHIKLINPVQAPFVQAVVKDSTDLSSNRRNIKIYRDEIEIFIT